MKKKAKIIVSVMISLLVLTAGSAATVMAQSGNDNADCSAEEVLDEEQIEVYVNQAVGEGTITPEEAAAILEWWEDRPEAVDTVLSSAVPFDGNESKYMYSYKNMTMQGVSATEGEMVQSRLMIKAQESEEDEDYSAVRVQKQVYKVNKVNAAVKVQARNKLSAAVE